MMHWTLLPLLLASSNGQDAALRAPLSSKCAASAPLERAGSAVRLPGDNGWIEFELDVSVGGRYRVALSAAGSVPSGSESVVAWVEDYVGNPDGRHYDITSLMPVRKEATEVAREGSPLDRGKHRMRLHHAGGSLDVLGLEFTLQRRHELTPTTQVQRTEGETWMLVWADEFDGEGLPDATRWTYDVGDWGWGNREPQFYTAKRVENARQESGHLIIEARRDDLGHPWTSARLTTRGKVSFQYGRIEIRAQVPVADGTWSAGWLLGDDYRDERSWPYCGEIDVLEGVGREIDDATGDGINHASCHTRAYYFKQGNHISNTKAVPGMGASFHVYTVDWWPDRVEIAVDGERYYVYDKHDGPLEWPFDRPQNLILNLAMGGGMGGAIDPAIDRQRLLVDYVRVYGRQ